jgi:hypothetical protein
MLSPDAALPREACCAPSCQPACIHTLSLLHALSAHCSHLLCHNSHSTSHISCCAGPAADPFVDGHTLAFQQVSRLLSGKEVIGTSVRLVCAWPSHSLILTARHCVRDGAHLLPDLRAFGGALIFVASFPGLDIVTFKGPKGKPCWAGVRGLPSAAMCVCVFTALVGNTRDAKDSSSARHGISHHVISLSKHSSKHGS